MEYTVTDFFLKFRTPFTIAHGTRTGTSIVLLKISCNGIEAYGEASLPPYLAENPESVKVFIHSFFKQVDFENSTRDELLHRLHLFSKNDFAAKACIDIAIHNWFARLNRLPLYASLGLKNSPLPQCTYTIGMDEEEKLKVKIGEAESFHILKIKLGGDHDRKIVETIRKHTSKPICVDANQGWKTKEHALDMIRWLGGYNVIFVEQPLPKEMTEEQAWLFDKSLLPLYADESVQVPEDVLKVSRSFHGVNVKLMKCGGISEALKMIAAARENHLKVMLGSMSETGCAIKAAAHISVLADYTDLDGPLLTENNPFDDVKYEGGSVVVK